MTSQHSHHKRHLSPKIYRYGAVLIFLIIICVLAYIGYFVKTETPTTDWSSVLTYVSTQYDGINNTFTSDNGKAQAIKLIQYMYPYATSLCISEILTTDLSIYQVISNTYVIRPPATTTTSGTTVTVIDPFTDIYNKINADYNATLFIFKTVTESRAKCLFYIDLLYIQVAASNPILSNMISGTSDKTLFKIFQTLYMELFTINSISIETRILTIESDLNIAIKAPALSCVGMVTLAKMSINRRMTLENITFTPNVSDISLTGLSWIATHTALADNLKKTGLLADARYTELQTAYDTSVVTADQKQHAIDILTTNNKLTGNTTNWGTSDQSTIRAGLILSGDRLFANVIT